MLETALLSVIGKLTGRKIIPTHHGDLILPPGAVNRVITTVMFEFYRYMALRAPAVIAYTQDYADNSYYLKPVQDKVRVIYPPIEMPEPNPERAAQLRAEWAPDGGPLIGYAGRFVQEKRPDLLIQSLDVILKKYPNARIVFAGQYDIPYENTWALYKPIVDKYKDHLIFLGLKDDMQFMADFFAATDLLALTSDSECFALVQVEAMLCGTPVVMSDTPGGRVPVRETGMGLIVPRGDSEAIGQAIVEVLDDPERFKRPREEIEAIFSFQETVDKYEATFREFAAK
jgi:glycosyltransferase involved in cell wall biosynthesis